METDHEELHRELEQQGDELEERRDAHESKTESARQDVKAKVSDQRTPGLQAEQEDVRGGTDAVDEAADREGSDQDSKGDDDSESGGSQGAGYREDET
jgi:hypothetical protein